MRTCPPVAIAGQPSACAGVGAANVRSNQARVAGEKAASGSMQPGYRRSSARTSVRLGQSRELRAVGSPVSSDGRIGAFSSVRPSWRSPTASRSTTGRCARRRRSSELRASLDVPLPDGPTDPVEVIEQLARDAEPGLTQTGGGRYFGFVVGGAVPAALAADWLAAAWDQNAGLAMLAPSASVAEEVAGRWLKDLLGVPPERVVRARDRLPDGARDRARRGAAPRAGGGRPRRRGRRPRRRAADPRRRRREAARHRRPRAALHRPRHRAASARCRPTTRAACVVDGLRGVLAESDAPTIVIGQLGEVNTGACDDLEAIADATTEAGAWLHVDGAFGLWAAASPSLRHLAAGSARADSWATDAHKWLNVPYDVGVAFCAHPESHRAALGIRSAYLVHSDPEAGRDPLDWTPEHSRRARGFATYAALRSLGRAGVADLVETTCARARALADGARGAARLRDPERGRAQPGALPLRGRRRHRRVHRRGAGRGRGVARRNAVGRPPRGAAVGLVLAHERGRRRACGARLRGRSRVDRARRRLTAGTDSARRPGVGRPRPANAVGAPRSRHQGTRP